MQTNESQAGSEEYTPTSLNKSEYALHNRGNGNAEDKH